MAELYIGLMSGTSMDGVDAVLVDLADAPPTCVATHEEPLPDSLRERLLALSAPQWRGRLEELGTADVEVGHLFARAARAVLEIGGVPPAEVLAIGSHGQTVRHRPEGDPPFSLQIGDPAVIAERTGISVVADFRRRDVAAGGQGAPMVPAFHAAWLRREGEDRAVLNLGGMANLTLLPGDRGRPVGGFDTGPGNVLMDAWVARHRQRRWDADGAWAAEGQVVDELAQALLADPYFRRPPPKSTGREQFHLGWLQAAVDRLPDPPRPADVQATLLEVTARSVADALARHGAGTRRLVVCGGGALNRRLLERLTAVVGPGVTVETAAAHGLDPRWVEATAFAWMAREALAGRPANVPEVTGAARPVVLGGIYRA